MNYSAKDILILETRKKELLAEIRFVEQRIEIVGAYLAGQQPEADTAQLASPGPKSAIILDVMSICPRFMYPKEVKLILRERGATEADWGKDFIYVHQAIRRLVKSGHIVKSPKANRYKIAE